MPFPGAQSFGYLIEEELIAEVKARLGEETEDYPDPEWLKLKTVGRAGGRPLLTGSREQQPLVWFEYIAGSGQGYELGRQLPARAEEIWNVFAVMQLKPDDMGLGMDEEEFKAWAGASADTLMRRLARVLTEFTPQVVDPITGLAPSSQNVTTWAMAGQSTQRFSIVYRIALRYVIDTSK